MISEQQIRSVALFFFFSLLDERAALHAADQAVAQLKTRLRGIEDDPAAEVAANVAATAKVMMVEVCAALFSREKKHVTRGKAALTFDSGWSLPDDTELAAWARFHKDASEDDLLALLFSRVIGASDTEIATALRISEGTARYRIGRAVKHLGFADRLAV